MTHHPSPEPVAGRLTLIGTVHLSGQYFSLIDLLAEYEPDRITLEVSPYAIAFRLRRAPRLLAALEQNLERLAALAGKGRADFAGHPEVASIRDLFLLPFEYRAARDYAAARAIPLELLDSSLVSARKLRRAAELVTFANLRVLTSLPAGDRCTGETARLARTLLGGAADPAVRLAFLAARRGAEGIGERDRRLAEALRRRYAPGRHLVHVGGWVHLVDDPLGETLLSRLSDLRPDVRLLV